MMVKSFTPYNSVGDFCGTSVAKEATEHYCHAVLHFAYGLLKSDQFVHAMCGISFSFLSVILMKEMMNFYQSTKPAAKLLKYFDR